MNPSLEIWPSACLFIIGPQLTANSCPDSARLHYKTILNCGCAMLSPEHVEGNIEQFMTLDPLKSMEKLLKVLRRTGLYEEWLRRTFNFSFSDDAKHNIPSSVQWLHYLQQMGAMLACTQYDTLLDGFLDAEAVTMSNEDAAAFAKWLKNGTKVLKMTPHTRQLSSVSDKTIEQQVDADAESIVGQKSQILHLHGVHTILSSIRLLPYSSKERESGNYDSDSSIPKEQIEALRELFHNKLVFLVGFDGEHFDPLLLSLLQLLYPESDSKILKNPPVLLSTTSSPKDDPLHYEPAILLRLKIKSMENLREVIQPGSLKSFSVGKLLAGSLLPRFFPLCISLCLIACSIHP